MVGLLDEHYRLELHETWSRNRGRAGTAMSRGTAMSLGGHGICGER